MEAKGQLKRSLGLRESLAIVVGSIIGTGVFLKTGVMSQILGSPLTVMAAWICGGLLSLAGALTYAELGSLFNESGGEFVYLREGYGRLPAFLYGWQRFWIGAPGSIAAYAVGAATFLGTLFSDWSSSTRTMIAIGFIAFFTLVNCLTVKLGGRVQVFMTALKVLMISLLIGGAFFFSHGSWSGLATPPDWQWHGFSAFGAAMIAAMWAYSGWENLPMAAGEVKDAQKTVPRALLIGTLIILLIYGLTNLSYFFALPFSEVLTSSSPKNLMSIPVAAKAAQTFLGPRGMAFLAIALMTSALGAMNGSILSSARVPFAMAQEGIFFKKLAYIQPTSHSPVLSVAIQGAWAAVLAASGTFDQLTDCVVFASCGFFALCAAGVFIFRIKMPTAPRTYRVPGYPIVPLLFVVISAALLVNAFVTSPVESGAGLAVTCLGIPVYLLFFKKQKG